MADKKKDADVIDLMAYRKRQENEGNLISSEVDRQRHKKIVTSKRVPNPQEAFELLEDEIMNGRYTIEGTFEQFVKSQGYVGHTVNGERQLYYWCNGLETRYIMNRNFLTDELSISVIEVNDFESEELENRVINADFGSASRARRKEYRVPKASEIMPLAIGGLGAILTAMTYLVTDLDTTALVGATTMCLPAVVYFVASAVNKRNNPGILPYSIAKRQIVAADDRQKFFDAAFGVKGEITVKPQ